MIFDLVRNRARKIAEVARKGVWVASAIGRLGTLGALSPSGLAAFARRGHGLKLKPHLSFMLHASNKPEKTALVAGPRRYSYAEADQLINRLANALRGAGLERGAPIALMMKNSAEYIIAQETLPRIGAAAVQIGTRLKAAEVAHIIDNAQPRAVIVDLAFEELVAEAYAIAGAPAPASILVVGAEHHHPGDGTAFDEALEHASPEDVPRSNDDSGGKVIVYTSGTTGKPKGASRDLGQTGLASVIDMLSTVGANHDDRHLVVCPLYHSAAPAFVKMIYSLGGTVVLLPKFDAEAVLGAVERERITSAFMVPTQLARLADADPSVRRRYDTSSLRWIMSGAAPLPTDTARRFQASFGPILWNFYGATETGLVSLAGPVDHEARPATVGRLLRDNEAMLLDDGGNQVASGQVGELWIRNGTLITDYHRNEAATRASRRDGFFSVGDLARLDSDGYLYIESRVHDMVISGGVNIYPREIEDVLHDHPAIAEAAVVGIPDPEWGESLAAFIVRRAGSEITAEEVILHCRDLLADYKRPRRVEFVAELPRNPTGKVLKRELRERV